VHHPRHAEISGNPAAARQAIGVLRVIGVVRYNRAIRMTRVRLLLPLAGTLAACLLASGCKRAPLTCGGRACDAGTLGGSGGGGSGAGGASAEDAGRDTVDGAEAGAGAGGAAGAGGGPASAACVASPTGPSFAFVGVPIDYDEDGIADQLDDCPATKNPTQFDGDGDRLGDACDSCPSGPDADRDGVCDAADNCRSAWNPDQNDTDLDGIGDACDTQACNAGAGPAAFQHNLALLLGHAEVTALLAGHRWRLATAGSYCANSNKRGVAFTIYDYDARQTLFPNLNVDDDILMTLLTDPFNQAGPTASREEASEAIALAQADKAVQQHSAAAGAPNASIFFFEFPGDARFAACDTGRCVDVLFASNGDFVFSVVVDLKTCRVLGFVDRN
jgi:hypothetical protein